MDHVSRPQLTHTTINKHAIANTGTTGHYLTVDDPCTNIHPTTKPISIQIPNGQLLHSTHTALLKEKALPLKD